MKNAVTFVDDNAADLASADRRNVLMQAGCPEAWVPVPAS
jgi:hypothetical protein